MGVPATQGQLRTTLEEMNIGDYIPCKYLSGDGGSPGEFVELGIATGEEIPIAINQPIAPNGLFYFIKVDKGLLIADRVIHTNRTWSQYMSSYYVEGKIISDNILIRFLTGGCAYVDPNGNPAKSDYGKGAFPTINEWDTYIVNSDLDGKITPGDDNVWHWSATQTFCKETPIATITTEEYRICRGGSYGLQSFRTNFRVTSQNEETGFRPVLEYIELDGSSRQTTLFY